MNAEAPTHEEVVQSLIRNANIELIEKINQSHLRCVDLTKRLCEVALESINAARETGLYLNELQSQLPHGKYGKLFTDSKSGDAPVIHFTSWTAWKYGRIANSYPEPITQLADGIRNMKELCYASGILQEPTGHGEQTRHEERSPFQSLTKFASEIQACLTGWRKQKPVEDWEPDLRLKVKSQLEPVVKFYQSL